MTRDMGAAFRALHRPGNPFVLVNVWDIGSAKLMAALGAEALATSSGAHAFTLGRPDLGQITRDEALSHASDLVAAVNIPVSGDFENGFGEAPETCAETLRLASEAGLAGISIEDIALPSDTPYDAALATERIRAAASAARALPRDFVLVARADGVMHGQYDLAEAIARIQAFEAAGADCVYIPAPPRFEDVATICNSVSVPVNALVSGRFAAHSRSDYAAAGAARLSLGAALARAAHKTLADAASAMLQGGDFGALGDVFPAAEMDKILSR